MFLSESAKEITGDDSDVKRVVKMCMNRSVSNRLVSKQECMVLLGKLDLVKSTEEIVTVSLSKSTRVRATSDRKKKSTEEKFIKTYESRPKDFEGMSLNQYWCHLKPIQIPHYVGITGQPKFPVSEEFARSVVITHIPWRKYPKKKKWIDMFNQYINSPDCDRSVTMAYARVRNRHYRGLSFHDPISKTADHSLNEMPDHAQALLDLTGDSNTTDYDLADHRLLKAPKGQDHCWSNAKKVRNKQIWLSQNI